ncbi:retron Ec67 family RNA-directed DNA polymerase/endonuclease [Achromobacter mucicolens]|uniref:retron Ec67 family RNA-directed DNA polymerase/endonuclease n=1 Tax=Achromobacter mucicolens TaxID=1389922 RepID=UPI0021D2D41D|nr:retron Ec67 family RNA-directed DNA polymerase/endonuclease [Achromobacter mucicolens]MCU6618787.1 retron Ec67 family RNA-directed DNA polymerase/endonuclease [Achromobacter mucicolens]
MSQLRILKGATQLAEIATLLNFKPSGLSYLLYVATDESKYISFEIPKKSGGMRLISAPSPKLKRLQSNLSKLLLNCLDELRNSGQYRDSMSHGFQRNRNILSNAKKHRAQRYVFNLDIADFFGSINFGRVRGFFIKDERFRLDPKIATIIAQIACRNGSLPQGSPCSPIISNLIGHILDIRLVGLAAKNGCRYSRYADDLTFSTNKKQFPLDIAILDATSHQWNIGNGLNEILQANRFNANPSKTRMQYSDSRQEVTGLVVNRKLNVRSEYRKLVRAMVHRLFLTGQFSLNGGAIAATSAGAFSTQTPGTLDQLHGMLGFIDGVDQHNIQEHNLRTEDLSQKEKTYRKFLLYKDFYLADKPILLCEGKTDNVYLKHAIRRLARHPLLGEKVGVDSFKYKIRLYKYAETTTGRILGLSGGTGEFPKFIQSYISGVKQFPALGLQHPILLILDNDSGANSVCGYLGTNLKRRISRQEDFIWIGDNLYLILTPTIAPRVESTIEDFFEPQLKQVEIDGKRFDPSDKADTTISYGKSIFASRVVEKFSEEINFEGFSPLLCRIELALQHFYDSKSDTQS